MLLYIFNEQYSFHTCNVNRLYVNIVWNIHFIEGMVSITQYN